MKSETISVFSVVTVLDLAHVSELESLYLPGSDKEKVRLEDDRRQMMHFTFCLRTKILFQSLNSFKALCWHIDSSNLELHFHNESSRGYDILFKLQKHCILHDP